MTKMFDLVVRGGAAVNHAGEGVATIGVKDAALSRSAAALTPTRPSRGSMRFLETL
jgi:hypothetical protein